MVQPKQDITREGSCRSPDEELRMWSRLERRTETCTSEIAVDQNKMSGVYVSDAFIVITLNSTRHFSGFQSEPASPPPTHMYSMHITTVAGHNWTVLQEVNTPVKSLCASHKIIVYIMLITFVRYYWQLVILKSLFKNKPFLDVNKNFEIKKVKQCNRKSEQTTPLSPKCWSMTFVRLYSIPLRLTVVYSI